MQSTVVGMSTSSVRAKKVPRAPITNSAGTKGRSTVPKGLDFETKPRGEVGEYCPLVRP